jgi:predicted ATPase with chaperone activity
MQTTALVEAPQTIRETGVPRILLEELALKMLFLNGEMSLADLADQMCLSLPIVEDLFQFFRREQLCEVKGMIRGVHVIALSSAGKDRAIASFRFSQYAGPAPVSLEDYSAKVRTQTVQQSAVRPADLERAFENLVLDSELLVQLGTAACSGTSLFLYGPPGTGKTTLACNIPAIFDDFVLIPHAIEVANQIIGVYDPSVHHRVEETMPEDWDRRWVVCRRPRVVAGGELSAEMLELQFNASSRLFTAPLQLKANNGVLVLDDFGRQRMRSDELLNRWMTPLDRRIDFLALPGGKKFEVPFDVLVVFSTNLDPRSLADEAFLRRIPNKISVTYATPEQFKEIFRKECEARLLRCEPGLAQYAVDVIAGEMKQQLSQSHVRDLINQILWSATYQGAEPQLTQSALRQACHNYFLPISDQPSRSATDAKPLP